MGEVPKGEVVVASPLVRGRQGLSHTEQVRAILAGVAVPGVTLGPVPEAAAVAVERRRSGLGHVLWRVLQVLVLAVVLTAATASAVMWRMHRSIPAEWHRVLTTVAHFFQHPHL